MRFNSFEVHNWKQFGSIKLDIHPRVTILTGANGAGKTTILRLLSQHFGWSNQQLSTPHKDEDTGIINYLISKFTRKTANNKNEIGTITYSDSGSSSIQIPESNNSPTYGIKIVGQKAVPGFFIPSHRPAFFYRQVPHLSTQKRKKVDAYNLVSNNYKSTAEGGGGNPSSYFIKETLVSWAINGYGNIVVEADKEQLDLYVGFEEILRKVLPKKLGFERFAIRNYEVVLSTQTGDFMIDAVSGGISAIIDLAWQIYMFPEKSSEGFVVIIDEVENHLHAEMQRELLPNFLEAFPRVQFIISTHSPLIVGSVKESKSYALRYNTDKKVEAILLDLKTNVADANEILRNVLGVPVTMPIWVEEELNSAIQSVKNKPVTKETLEGLRERLRLIGLEELMPEAVIKGFSK